MTRLRVQLWVYTTGTGGGGGNPGRPLPKPVSWDVSFAASDVGALTVTYADNTPGATLIRLGVEIALRIQDPATGQLVDPPGNRFLALRCKKDLTNPISQTTYTCPSYGWLLGRVRQYVTTGLADDGRRTFAAQDPRQVINTLVEEAKARGGTADMSVATAAALPALGFTPGVLPVGNEQIAPGLDALGVLTDFVARGSCEWTTTNRAFVIVRALGVDKSGPVRLRYGRDIDQAPDDASIESSIGQVLIQGDAGAYLALTNPGADAPWGLLDGSVSAGGTKDLGTMTVFGQATLDTGAQARVQMTRSLRFADVAFLPLVDYGIGDTITAPGQDGAPTPLRVQQITMRFGTDGVSGNLVLNDRFTERDLRQAAALRRLQNGATSSGGAGTTPSANPGRTPKPVTSLLADSVGYVDGSGTPKGQVSLSWVLPTQATDGTPMAAARYEVQARETAAFDATPRPGAVFAQVGLVNHPEARWDGSGYDAYSVWEFQVRAVAANGNASEWVVLSKQIAVDGSPPPVPSQPIVASSLGVLRVTWDGLDFAGQPMPPRFDHIEMHVWYDPVFIPTMGDTYVSSQKNAGLYPVTGQPGGTVKYVRFVAVSRTGVKSAPTNPTVGQTINRVAGPDILANTITTNEMIVGVMDGYLITGAIIRTAAAGQRVQLDLAGVSAFNSGGTRLTFIDAATGLFHATGADISGTISAAVISGGQINGAVINSADIRSTLITGGWIQTATGTGARVVLNEDGLHFFNAGNARTIFLSTITGDATFTGTVTASNITNSTGSNVALTNGSLNGTSASNVTASNTDLTGNTSVSGPGNSWSGGSLSGASYESGSGAGVGIGVGNAGGASAVNVVKLRASGIDVGYLATSTSIILGLSAPASSFISLSRTTDRITYNSDMHSFLGNIEYYGSLTSVSTRDTKTKMRAIGPAEVDALLSLDPITFKYRKGGGDRRAGVIAEQVLAAGLHPLVTYDKDRTLRGVAYSEIPMYLLAAAKRQHGEIAALTTRLETLEKEREGVPV